MVCFLLHGDATYIAQLHSAQRSRFCIHVYSLYNKKIYIFGYFGLRVFHLREESSEEIQNDGRITIFNIVILSPNTASRRRHNN